MSSSKKSRGAKSIIHDPRWPAFVERYCYDWERACEELFGKHPTWQQCLVIDAVQEEGSKTTVSSGHGTGKSDLTSMITIIYMLCYELARVVIIANKIGQVKAGVFKYLRINWNTLITREPWIEQYFVLTDTMFYEKANKGVWSVAAKGFRPGNEESLAGEHAEHLLNIIDEASGVSPKAFGVITGSLTQKDNRMLLLSQPTRPSGYFYDSHHSLAKNADNPNGVYTAIVLNSEESPLVTREFIVMKLAEYGGRDSPEYKIKVLGIFPENAAGFLLGRDQCERAQRRRVMMHKGWGWIATCDVGNGRDKSVINIGRVSGDGDKRRYVPFSVVEYDGATDPVSFGHVIHSSCDPIKFPNISIGVDGDGVGSATIKVLNNLGRNVQVIRWGKPVFSDEEKKRFANKRAKACIWARDAVIYGRMVLDKNPRTIDQASKIPSDINEAGQYTIMKKQIMKQKLNISSPDRWDTYCFVALMSYTPAEVDMDYDVDSVRADALKYLDDFDDAEDSPLA